MRSPSWSWPCRFWYAIIRRLEHWESCGSSRWCGAPTSRPISPDAHSAGRGCGRGLSPNKTWSGFAGGLVAAMLAGFLLGLVARLWGQHPPFDLWALTVLFRYRFGGGTTGRSGRIGPQAPFRREGFEPAHPGTWRRDGSPRRIFRRMPADRPPDAWALTLRDPRRMRVGNAMVRARSGIARALTEETGRA